MGQEVLSSEASNEQIIEKGYLSKVESLAPVVSIETKLNQPVVKEDKKLLKEKISRLNEEIIEMEEKLQAKKITDRDYGGQVPTTVYLGDGDIEITPKLLDEKKEELTNLKEAINELKPKNAGLIKKLARNLTSFFPF